MVEKISKKHRSWVMGRIRSRDTEIELIVRSLLHRSGFRFSLRGGGLPGKPDIVLGKHRAVVFVNGCFWHRHGAADCTISKIPKNNRGMWISKLERNVKRDKANRDELNRMGWKVYTLWECELRSDPAGSVSRLIYWLSDGNHRIPAEVNVGKVVSAAREKHKLILRLKTGSAKFKDNENSESN